MSSFILIFITSILAENIVLSKFLGYSFFEIDENNNIIIGILVGIVTLISILISYLVNKYILITTNTDYLQVLVCVLIIIFITKLIEILFKKCFKKIYKLIEVYIPFIMVNCAVLGVIILSVRSDYTLLESIIYGLGSSIGLILIMYIFNNLNERMRRSPIIKSFRGVPILLITAGIMSLIFSRFIG